MPVAATEDQLALQASIRDWAKRAAPLEAVRGLEPGGGAAAGGAAADGAEAWFWVPSGHPGVTVTSRAPADFSRPLAGVRLDGGGDGAGAGPVAGGTTQILLSVVAERVLGLPREEAR